MFSLPYYRLGWKLYRFLIIFSSIFIGLLQFLVIWIFNTINASPVFETIFQQLPPQMRLLFENEFMPNLSIAGAVALGFNHPIVLFLMGLSAIIIPARQIAGESENGLLELLLSLPYKRKQLLISLWIFAASALLCMVLGAFTGSLIALLAIHHMNSLFLGHLLRVSLNLWVLFLLIMSCTLMVSVYKREGSRAGLTGAIIVFTFYFFYFLSSIWELLEFTKPYNIFNYYQPQKLIFGGTSLEINLAVLLLLTFLCITISLFHFETRDIP
jgi:ABC-type transport system involved in multi-copper enzyme maturation permease subunit